MSKRYIPHDAWSKRAESEGFRARSVYKLKELDQRFRLLRPGIAVLDLGAAPGSWLQYMSGRIGPRGLAIGIDIVPIKAIAPNVVTIQRDIADVEGAIGTVKQLMRSRNAKSSGSLPVQHTTTDASDSSESSRLDLVLSDAAPSTSGIGDIDQWRSIELCRAALAIAKPVLRSGGMCVLKIFRGADFDAFLRETMRNWKNVRIVNVRASRDRSREIYLVMKK